jgi:hypothetical protein
MFLFLRFFVEQIFFSVIFLEPVFFNEIVFVQLETRVRQALCRKDEILFQLRQQIEGKDLRIAQTEKLLDQQKHDFVKSFMQDSKCVTSTENKKKA